jgi:hypothetical protein
LFVANP